MLRDILVIVVVGLRKLRRVLGLPVLDLSDSKGSFKSAVREMENQKPKAEKPKSDTPT